MSNKGEGYTQVVAQIVGDKVDLRSNDETGLITFDRTPAQVTHCTFKVASYAKNEYYYYISVQILKRDVHVHEELNINFSKLRDYPPKLLIYVNQQEFSYSNPPEVQVIGLDRLCFLPILGRKCTINITASNKPSLLDRL